MEYEKTGNVDFGIDLGTTNSVIAFFNGEDASIVPDHATNMNYTPSAVAIDDDGNITVGESARRVSLYDPFNAAVEFKLKMGMTTKYHFADSGMDLLAEELSAEVLKYLKNSAYQELDCQIDSAVITVPADFSPIKIFATKKAAELAGFTFAPIIMEPVAAAYAYHRLMNENMTCMIYDFGETTFESSIVTIDDDDFLNLSHSYDSRLGGNLMDWDIVNEIFAKKISDELGLDDFSRREPKYSKAFSKLKTAAENITKDMSFQENVEISIDSLMIHEPKIKIKDDDLLKLAKLSGHKLDGNIMDNDAVYDILAKINNDLGLDNFNKKEIEYADLEKMKAAFEQSKISDNAKELIGGIEIKDPEIYDFKYSLSKSELKKVMAPHIKKTLNHCHDVLKNAHMNASDIDCIILVGSSTLNPIIKESLEDEFGIPVKNEIDPTTVVARGAALFAGTLSIQ